MPKYTKFNWEGMWGWALFIVIVLSVVYINISPVI